MPPCRRSPHAAPGDAMELACPAEGVRSSRKRKCSPALRSLMLWTSCSSVRRHSAGYCFVPDCERVRVDGGAAPTVPQGRPRGHEANPLPSPREGIRAESVRRPGKRGRTARTAVSPASAGVRRP